MNHDRMKYTLFKTSEGRLLLGGFFLGFLLLAAIVFYAATDFHIGKTLFLAFIAHTVGGRAAGIGLCIIDGFGAFPTILYNFYLEVLIVLIVYALFVLSTTHYLRVEWIIRIMERIAHKAAEQKDRIERYGWLGIFLFVMAPLPVTGPVAGSIIGYMLRLSVVKNFSATMLGTLTAIVIWYFFFDFLEQQFHVIRYVFIAIVVMVVIPYLGKITAFIRSCRHSDRIN